MDSWLVHFFDQYGIPRIAVVEVQAADISAAVASACSQSGRSMAQVISARLKAPIIVE